jgi:SPOR domain
VKTLIYTLFLFSLLFAGNRLHAQQDTVKPSSGLAKALGNLGKSTGRDTAIARETSGPGDMSSSQGEGKIAIHADSKIDSLEHKHRKAKLKGYRIQVFLGSYAQCRDERAKYQKSGLTFPSYQIQNAPDYAVRVGDFRALVEAMSALAEIKLKYPGAFIISDEIEPPKLGE